MEFKSLSMKAISSILKWAINFMSETMLDGEPMTRLSAVVSVGEHLRLASAGFSLVLSKSMILRHFPL
jgi:hypothetical protein